jgi:hypothetical protein
MRPCRREHLDCFVLSAVRAKPPPETAPDLGMRTSGRRSSRASQGTRLGLPGNSGTPDPNDINTSAGQVELPGGPAHRDGNLGEPVEGIRLVSHDKI